MDEVGKLRRLQAVTLAVLLPTLALTVLGRVERATTPPAPSPTPPVPSATPSPTPEPGPTVDASARAGLASLGSRVAALEGAPARGARVDASYARRYACRITNQRSRGLVAEVQRLDAPGEPRKTVLSAESGGRIAVAADLGAIGPERHGLLVAQALVRTDNGIREKESHPHRLALVCADRAGTEQAFELAGCYFQAASEPEDLLLKTAANTCTLVVTDGCRLDLAVDVAPLRAWLTEGGLYEVHLRLGPMIVFEGAVAR